ncbi:hypothetical protein MRX96_049095, partial [Rhipicephalus microplus]
MLLKTTDYLEHEHESHVSEIKAQLESIAKDLKHLAVLIDSCVSDDNFAEECAGVRKYQMLIE